MSFMTAIAGALAPFAGAFTAVGTIATTIAGINAANAQSASAVYNAKVQERDAFVADQNRKLILEQTNKDVADKHRENRRVLSSIRAAYGASGVEMSGSPLDVLMDTAVEQELDVSRIKNEGDIRAREAAMQTTGAQEGATLSRMEASSARRSRVGMALGNLGSGFGTQLSRAA